MTMPRLDWSDYIALLALITSVFFPLVLRHLDRLAMRPDIQLHITHSHIVEPSTCTEVLDSVLSSNSLIAHEDRRAEMVEKRHKFVQKMMMACFQYHEFSVVIQNRSSAPATLTDLKVDDFFLDSNMVPNNVTFEYSYGFNEISQRWEVNPLVALDPGTSRRLKYIVAFAVIPDEEGDHWISGRLNEKRTKRAPLPEFITKGASDAECENPEAAIKDQYFLSALNEYVLRPKIRYLNFSMRDNFGKWWRAKSVELKDR